MATAAVPCCDADLPRILEVPIFHRSIDSPVCRCKPERQLACLDPQMCWTKTGTECTFRGIRPWPWLFPECSGAGGNSSGLL